MEQGGSHGLGGHTRLAQDEDGSAGHLGGPGQAGGPDTEAEVLLEA